MTAGPFAVAWRLAFERRARRSRRAGGGPGDPRSTASATSGRRTTAETPPARPSPTTASRPSVPATSRLGGAGGVRVCAIAGWPSPRKRGAGALTTTPTGTTKAIRSWPAPGAASARRNAPRRPRTGAHPAPRARTGAGTNTTFARRGPLRSRWRPIACPRPLAREWEAVLKAHSAIWLAAYSRRPGGLSCDLEPAPEPWAPDHRRAEPPLELTAQHRPAT